MDDLPHTPASNLQWWGLTDQGRVRQNNEDSYLCLQFDAQEVRYLGRLGEAPTASADFVFAVSDGMGGAKAGEFASRITVEKITRLLPRAFKQSAQGLKAGIEDVLEELFDQIHHALTVLGECYEECAGMGATLSLCWFAPGWVYFAHIGDSRIYYLPAGAGGIRQLTQDDTHVGWLFRQGQLNERQARDHPRRNVLQKALGAGHQFVNPQVGAVACEPGDLFLLCTDGLTEGLFNEQLLQRLRVPDEDEAAQNPAQRLVAASLERSGRDNTTALVVAVG
ncbi:MAG: protein phosphatase 2C domain-containing protein [Chthoniobacter sp.]|nr:protein phosphatase 2C domain-containing protein [Chthoniobacter sp.]